MNCVRGDGQPGSKATRKVAENGFVQKRVVVGGMY